MDAKTETMNDTPLTADVPEDNFDQAPEEQAPEHVLSKPIQAHGEEVRVLRWREPTGGDIETAGNPVYLDFSGAQPTITFNEKKMAAMISLLTAIPPSSVRQMTAKDPRIFLEQTISQLARHKHWTSKVVERIREQQEADAPPEP